MSKMLDALREQRAAKAAEAAELLAGEPTAEALTTVEERHAEIETLDAQITKVEATEARAASIVEARAAVEVPTVGSAKIVSEPMTYSEHGSRSFAKDLINATLRNDAGSWDALHRHMDEVAVESRAVGRTDGAIGEFVPPLWLTDLYAQTLRPGRATADLLTKMALPGGTDSVNIPRITQGADVGVQTDDNQSTTNQDMTTTSVSAPVRTISGWMSVSIQTIDQSPLAGGIDRMVFADLMQAYDYRLNQQVLQGVGTAGQMYGLVNTAGIGTVAYGGGGTPVGIAVGTALVQAISQVAKNRYKGAEAIVLHPSIWYWLANQADGNGRPLVVPTANGPFNSFGVTDVPAGAQGPVGTFMGVNVVLDPAIALASSAYPAVVASFSDTVLMESGVRTRVLPEIDSANLGVRFQLFAYAAIAARYPAGIVKVTGVQPVTGY